jgi:hypothetical protein
MILSVETIKVIRKEKSTMETPKQEYIETKIEIIFMENGDIVMTSGNLLEPDL